VLWLGSNRLVTTAVLRSLEWQYLPLSTTPAALPQADVIIVLGGSTRAAAFPRPMAEMNEAGDRLLYAAWLYQQQAAPRILLSGGHVPLLGLGDSPEAESMAEIMARLGIPPEALLLETASRNTYENAVETQNILAKEGVTRIILVTSAIHMPRAYRVFAKTGLTVIPAPTDFLVTADDWRHLTRPEIDVQLINLLPTADNLKLLSAALKEYIGIVIYKWRGWL
jgi:uncharacterized SAM-binding protein YcdF (DUF218 family)